jgi:hypothetical protein
MQYATAFDEWKGVDVQLFARLGLYIGWARSDKSLILLTSGGALLISGSQVRVLLRPPPNSLTIQGIIHRPAEPLGDECRSKHIAISRKRSSRLLASSIDSHLGILAKVGVEGSNPFARSI